jgi:hypothetical protein
MVNLPIILSCLEDECLGGHPPVCLGMRMSMWLYNLAFLWRVCYFVMKSAEVIARAAKDVDRVQKTA